MLADDEADGGITDPAIDVDRQVEADQIAVLEVVVVRDAVQHGIVHGNADIVRERTGTEIRSVIDVAGFGALAVHDALVHELVDVQQIGADLGVFLQVAQDMADETTSRLHFLNLFRSLQFNHGSKPTSDALQRQEKNCFTDTIAPALSTARRQQKPPCKRRKQDHSTNAPSNRITALQAPKRIA